MRQWAMMTGVAGLALALMVTTVDARGRGPAADGKAGWGRGDFRGGRLLAQLNLTEEQQAALKALRDQRMETKKALRAEAQQAFEDLRALAQRDDATVEEVEAIEARLDDIHRRMRTERRAFRLEAYDLLTPEQKAQVPTAWRLAIGPGPGMGMGPGGGKGWHGGRGWGWGKGGPGMGGGPGWGGGPCWGGPPPDAPEAPEAGDDE